MEDGWLLVGWLPSLAGSPARRRAGQAQRSEMNRRSLKNQEHMHKTHKSKEKQNNAKQKPSTLCSETKKTARGSCVLVVCVFSEHYAGVLGF